MSCKILLLVFFCFCSCKNEKVELPSEKDSKVNVYIQKYRNLAKAEQEKHGIPTSIKLAQGILESKSGRSELAIRANNHFGMKCGKLWKGAKYNTVSDEWDRRKSRMISRNACFKSFVSVGECYSAHSQLLKQSRYKKLFALDRRDYKNWALGIQKLGYASDPDYAKKIISIIERYRLFELDKD